MKFTIQITQDHIDRGLACNSGKCPGALAFLDQIPGIRAVSVGTNATDIWFHQQRTTAFLRHWGLCEIENPDELVDFIEDFDGRDDIPKDDRTPAIPIAFEVEIPDEFLGA